MTEIAIIGAGIHPFGRHAETSALAMGAYAVRAALADANLSWNEIEFAYGGSEDGGNADTLVSELGPTGLPFTNVKNGCATGGSSLVAAVRALESGAYDVGLVVGFDKLCEHLDDLCLGLGSGRLDHVVKVCEDRRVRHDPPLDLGVGSCRCCRVVEESSELLCARRSCHTVCRSRRR